MISFLYLSVALACALAEEGDGQNNMWLVHTDSKEVARGVVQELDPTYKDEEVEWAEHQKTSERSMYDVEKRQNNEHFDDVKEQSDLNWFLKTIRDTPEFKNCKTGVFACTTLSPHLLAYLEHLGQTDVKKLGTISTEPAFSTTLNTYEGATKPVIPNPYKLSAYAARFNDPKWRDQWFVQDYRTTNIPVMDHNVVPVYDMDIKVSTVTVGVVGDGVREHADLGDNYKYDLSFDFCLNKKGSSPTRRYNTYETSSTHDTVGTSSAGVIAMTANNDLCGVGIAPGASIAGLKMTGCETTPPDNVVASALMYELDNIDIFCNTWTSDDESGNKLVELSYPVENALQLGTSTKRKNKGAIYVFPSGSNRKNNNCATNGFVNNPYVITIGSAASDGLWASYSERCAAVFAAAYSGDVYTNTENIPSITADGGCSNYASDKPISAAVASGILALVLERRPHLTYRDMMHLIVMTAEVAPLANCRNSWHRNGRGLWVSNDFGFGLLNAKNMITVSENWKTVPEKLTCVLTKKLGEPLRFANPIRQIITFDSSQCTGRSNPEGQDNPINYLEHVEIKFTVDYTFRGAILMNITSPAKTNTELLEPRIKDYSRDGYMDWNVMSVHNWGENPKGLWDITVFACRIAGEDDPHGYIHELTLKLHGTKEMPHHYDKPRKYAAFRLLNGDTNMFV